MLEIKAISYEEARTDFLKTEMEKAENRIKFWQLKLKHAKNAIAEMEAHDNASNAGWEVNFYKDALEALAAQPKWISAEEPPKHTSDYLVHVHVAYPDGIYGYETRTAYYNTVSKSWTVLRLRKYESISEPTYWMSLPNPPKEDKHGNEYQEKRDDLYPVQGWSNDFEQSGCSPDLQNQTGV